MNGAVARLSCACSCFCFCNSPVTASSCAFTASNCRCNDSILALRSLTASALARPETADASAHATSNAFLAFIALLLFLGPSLSPDFVASTPLTDYENDFVSQVFCIPTGG